MIDEIGIEATPGTARRLLALREGNRCLTNSITSGAITKRTAGLRARRYANRRKREEARYSSTVNELQSVTDPTGNTGTYTYDPQTGNLQKSLDPNNQPAKRQLEQLKASSK